MRKILLSLLQLAVTVALLIWVFHDPTKRAQMAIALRAADFRWIVLAIGAYTLVEVAAAVRWQILLKVQDIHLPIPRTAGLFLLECSTTNFFRAAPGATS